MARNKPNKAVFTQKHQDVHVVMNWQALNINNPPSCSGVYAITNANMTKWFYIGKSQNIAKRIMAKNHPIQVTKDVNIGQSYFYLCVSPDDIGWFERYAIKRLDPEWNGSTSFGTNWYSPWVSCDITGHYLDDATRLAVLAALES